MPSFTPFLRWFQAQYWLRSLVPFLAAMAAFLVGAVMLFALRANPVTAYAALIQGAFGSLNSFADTIVKATPLLFIGAGICVAFRGGMINIGGEGQMVVGALAGTITALSLPTWPSWAFIPLCLTAGLLGGALWGTVPGVLKAYLKVNEILTTIMMNGIAAQLMNYLLSGPIMDPAQIQQGSFIPQTAQLPEASFLPRLAPTRLNLGVGLAILVASWFGCFVEDHLGISDTRRRPEPAGLRAVPASESSVMRHWP